MAEVDGMTEE
jgi:26S proteasome regulatory subunit T5